MQSFSVSLRLWRKNGDPVTLQESGVIWGVGLNDISFEGVDEVGRAATSTLAFIEATEDESDEDEYASSVKTSIETIIRYLSYVSSDAVISLQQSGITVDLFFNFHLDSFDSIDMEIPTELHAELTRLSIPMVIFSERM